MTNLMLAWQQAALLALGCGVAGMVLAYAGHAFRAWRWGLHAGPFLREAGVVVGLYALWQLAGNLATGGFTRAVANARWVWDSERTLRLPSELAVQRLLLPHPLLSEIANLYYATMHFGMLIAMLIWLFAWHRDGYPAVRNAMAASTAICLLISFIPVAPPRLLPGVGIVDLAARYGESVYSAVGSAAGADQLSAMPSVHVAWSLLVAWAVLTRGTSRWRWLILLHPAVTVFVVVATGNHFWADGIVAAVIAAAVISAQWLLFRLRLARLPCPTVEPAHAAPATPAVGHLSDGHGFPASAIDKRDISPVRSDTNPQA
jgi:PAP2 superfamily